MIEKKKQRELGRNYKIESGDSLCKIAKKFELPDWLRIYNHPKNIKFKDEYPDDPYKKIKEGEVIWVPSPSFIQIKTGNSYIFCKKAWKLFCNGHMHIQSNNCCPLPIQWSTVASKVARPARNRKFLTNLAKCLLPKLRRFVKIGRLNTGVIAGIYMGTAMNKDMRREDSWIVIREKRWDKKVKGWDEAKTREQIGKMAEIRKLTEGTIKNFNENFTTQTYYRNSDELHIMSTALLMDMSFSHYWGRFGIPVGIPDSSASGKFVFINDFIKAGISDDSMDTFAGASDYNVHCISNVKHPCRQIGYLQHLYAKSLDDREFSFKKAFQKFSNGDDDIFMSFGGELSENSKLTKRSFVHLVQELPGDEQEWFEEYEAQILHSEGAAIKFPLKIIPFYHYDPRRHCEKDKKKNKISKLANTIVKEHAFYTYTLDFRKNKMVVTPHPEMNTENFWEKCFKKTKKTIFDNKEAFERIFSDSTTGIFWGIKTYPRMGYSPDDFDNYPQLEELYKHCQDNEIPIMTHCSREPMMIADYYCYTRYDNSDNLEKSKKYEGMYKDMYNIHEEEYRYVDNFTAPKNWEKVLENYKNLKLCLAHFGGYNAWTDVGSFETIEKNFPTNPGKLPTKEKLRRLLTKEKRKEQRASIYYTWIRSIPEMMDYDNLYVDISYFHLPAPEKKVKNWKNLGWDQKYTTSKAMAKNFLFLLKKFPKLKERIIIGTDWPMTEIEKQIGIGTILSRLFHLMSIISKDKDINYDAWHQFAVVNPLQYLGLLDKSGKGYEIKIKKLEDYVEKLKKISSNCKLPTDAQFFVNSCEFELNTLVIIDKFKKNKFIPDSADIKRKGNKKLIILEALEALETKVSDSGIGTL